ncbi:hypothetical protein PCANC_25011 [Puccinia coronata f. sp. avenae]|uniref:Uncharacterized protein n=1 Tax=Puccinia coronata f. sp. avenae TaxID=200324 RepID=A0A2N5UKS0_9BASI|nr:hypothetical protein PCANC_25011 [Puccinia coronata f. sp. avenae]PLW38325.1 hypothetical protein PCASD_09009 [Puccinia coronata f. sp. avenae]
MVQGWARNLPGQTTHSYNICIRHLEGIVRLLLDRMDTAPLVGVPAAPLAFMFQYSMDQDLVPVLAPKTASLLANNQQNGSLKRGTPLITPSSHQSPSRAHSQRSSPNSTISSDSGFSSVISTDCPTLTNITTVTNLLPISSELSHPALPSSKPPLVAVPVASVQSPSSPAPGMSRVNSILSAVASPKPKARTLSSRSIQSLTPPPQISLQPSLGPPEPDPDFELVSDLIEHQSMLDVILAPELEPEAESMALSCSIIADSSKSESAAVSPSADPNSSPESCYSDSLPLPYSSAALPTSSSTTPPAHPTCSLSTCLTTQGNPDDLHASMNLQLAPDLLQATLEQYCKIDKYLKLSGVNVTDTMKKKKKKKKKKNQLPPSPDLDSSPSPAFATAAVGALSMIDEETMAYLNRKNDPRYRPIEDSEYIEFDAW